MTYLECRMPQLRDELEIIRLLVAAIEKHAQGEVAKLAAGILAELRNADFEIVRQPKGDARSGSHE